MRRYLLTKFICTKCGKNLNVVRIDKKSAEWEQGEPTGAEKVDEIVGIEPCNTCLEPLYVAKQVIKDLIKLVNEN